MEPALRSPRFTQTPVNKHWCKIFLFFSVNVPKFSSLNTKPYIRSVYFKRLHFSKTVETYYTVEGEKHHREKNKTKRKVNIFYKTRKIFRKQNFFDTAVQNIYNWVFVENKTRGKISCLYNWGVKLGSLCTREREREKERIQNNLKIVKCQEIISAWDKFHTILTHTWKSRQFTHWFCHKNHPLNLTWAYVQIFRKPKV